MTCICCDRPTEDVYVDEGGESLCDRCAQTAEGEVYYADGTPASEDLSLDRGAAFRIFQIL